MCVDVGNILGPEAMDIAIVTDRLELVSTRSSSPRQPLTAIST